jgi:hypothetical protein
MKKRKRGWLPQAQFERMKIREKARALDEHRFGKMGAASGVRHIDPATYQPPIVASPATIELPPAQNKTLARLKDADRILLRDARRRGGKRNRDKVRNKIMQGRYR